LVPNLVSVVKGAGKLRARDVDQSGRGALQGGRPQSRLIHHRRSEKLKKFEAAQGELSGSLSRLLVVAEQYPQLKATDSYRDLQSQLEGTENRIAVARKRYIESVAEYNGLVQRFPTSIGASMRGRAVRPPSKQLPAPTRRPK